MASVGEQVQPAGACGADSCAEPPYWLFRGRVPSLDGLRALSIMMVLSEHCSSGVGFPFSRKTVLHLGLGGTGVSLFFGISGFLITTLLLREERNCGHISLSRFYFRRALRIFPVYICFLLCLTFLSLNGNIVLQPRDWLGILTYTSNLIDGKTGVVAHLWSLSLEEQFYLAWPFVLVISGGVRARLLICIYLVAAPFIRLCLRLFFREYDAIAYTSPVAMEPIAIGCLLALVAFDGRLRSKLLFVERHSKQVFFVSFGLLLGLAWVDSAPFKLLLRYSVIGLAAAGVIWSSAVGSGTFIGKFLNSRPMVLLGMLSYSIYIWQQLFFQRNFYWLVGIGLAFAAGGASYVLIERPFLRLKVRLTTNRRDLVEGR